MSELKKMQNRLYNLFKSFDLICSEYGLRYYMLGGTMLGAIRHEGFIPWDDDIDVGMPREDYLKFISILKSKELSNIDLKVGYESKDLIFPYSKLLDSNTTLIENRLDGIVEGIYIDIFPLDGLGNKKLLHKIHYYEHFFLQGCLYYKQEPKKRKNLLKNILQKLVGIVSIETIVKRLNQIEIKHTFDNSLYVGNLSGNWGYREIMEKNIYGTPVKNKFEDTLFFGVEDPEAYLTSLYGDYKALPPIDKQVTHHDYIYINLDLPYKSYKKY